MDVFFKAFKLAYNQNYILTLSFVVFIALGLGIFEMLGIGLLVPLITNMLVETSTDNYGIIGSISKVINTITFVNPYFLILIIFLIKTVCSLLLWYLVSKIIFRVKSSIQYWAIIESVLNKRTTETEKKVLIDTHHLQSGILSPVISAVMEVGVISVLLIGAGYIIGLNSILTMALFFVIFGYIPLKFIRKISRNKGKQREKEESKAVNLLSHFILNKKLNYLYMAKGMSKKGFFLDASQTLIKLGQTMAEASFLNQMPRFYLENMLSIIIVIGSWYISYKASFDFEQVILIGMVAIRILPSFNRLARAFQNIAFTNFSSGEVIQSAELGKKLYSELSESKYSEINNIDLFFNDKNFVFKKGEWYQLRGASGSGKSTLLEKILEKNNSIFEGFYLGKSIGYAPQNNTLTRDPIGYQITLKNLVHEFDSNKFQDILNVCGLSKVFHNLKINNEKLFDDEYCNLNLSGGEIQRVNIARALYHAEDFLILDETFNGLDIHSIEQILNNIKFHKYNFGVIVVSHVDLNSICPESFTDVFL